MSAILGLAITGIGAAFKGASSAIRSRKERDALNAQKTQMENLATQYAQLVKDNKLDAASAIERIGAHFDQVGGRLNDMFKEQMRLGTEQINSRLKSTMDQIQFGIDQAKTRADRAERDFLEQEEDKLKAIRSDFDKSTQQIKNTAVQRRLGASGAMAAAIGQAQEKYGEIQKAMAESKSRFFRGLSEQFADVVKAGGFQTLQAQAQAGREGLGLQAQIGGQQAQTEANLAQQRFGAEEGARERAFNLEGGQLQMQQQADALGAQANAISPLSGLFGEIGGAASQFGSDLFGASLKSGLPTSKLGNRVRANRSLRNNDAFQIALGKIGPNS